MLAGPTPSGSADASRLCRGCSHPHRHLPAQAAPSFSGLLRQPTGAGLSPPLKQQRLTAHEARPERVRHHLRRPDPPGRKLIMRPPLTPLIGQTPACLIDPLPSKGSASVLLTSTRRSMSVGPERRLGRLPIRQQSLDSSEISLRISLLWHGGAVSLSVRTEVGQPYTMLCCESSK